MQNTEIAESINVGSQLQRQKIYKSSKQTTKTIIGMVTNQANQDRSMQIIIEHQSN
jgi:hypothetical protein